MKKRLNQTIPSFPAEKTSREFSKIKLQAILHNFVVVQIDSTNNGSTFRIEIGCFQKLTDQFSF